MKKLLIALLLSALSILLGIKCQGQTNDQNDSHGIADFGHGEDFTYKLPVFVLDGGYCYKNIVMKVIIEASLSRAEFSNNLFGISAGYDFHHLVPGIDFYYNNMNGDDVSRNGFVPGYSLTYNLVFSDRGGIFARAVQIKGTTQVLIGFHAIIGSLKKQ